MSLLRCALAACPPVIIVCPDSRASTYSSSSCSGVLSERGRGISACHVRLASEALSLCGDHPDTHAMVALSERIEDSRKCRRSSRTSVEFSDSDKYRCGSKIEDRMGSSDHEVERDLLRCLPEGLVRRFEALPLELLIGTAVLPAPPAEEKAARSSVRSVPPFLVSPRHGLPAPAGRDVGRRLSDGASACLPAPAIGAGVPLELSSIISGACERLAKVSQT